MRAFGSRAALWVAVIAGAGASLPATDIPTVEEATSMILAAGPSDGWAHGWLGELCDSIGPRLSGSRQMDEAIAFAVRTMAEAGLDRVWTEPVMVPAWERGRERGQVTAPFQADLTVLGIGNSVGTPPEGIEAEVVAVASFEELTARAAEVAGKIVLFDPPWEGYGTTVRYRSGGAAAAARHGAVAVLVRSVTGTSLATPHTGMLTYEEGIAPVPAASLTVEDAGRLHRLEDRGESVRVRLVMGARSLPDREQANVVGELRGREIPDEVVLIGAHLDSWDVGTGAHDDGTGCAITLGAARLLKVLGLRPRRTVRVVLFASEEYGGQGGRAYLEAHREEIGSIVAALESDSGGFAPDGFSVRCGTAVIDRIRAMAAPLEGLGADRVREGWAGVDIGPLVDQGVPGIGHRTRNEPYFGVHHSPADTFDKVDPDDLAANVAAVAALVYAVAEDPEPLGSCSAAEP